MKEILFVLTFFTFLMKIAICDFPCSGDWVAFNDEKCFKFVKSVVTREEAEQICNNMTEPKMYLSFFPTLVSIRSPEEQQFLENYLFEFNNALDSIWISAKRKADNECKFEWNDGSELNYHNWVQGHPTNNTDRKCVQMQSVYDFRNYTNIIKSSNVGKWVDIPCERSNLVVCEKMQTWSFPQLQKAFLVERRNIINSLDILRKEDEFLRKENEVLRNENEILKSSIYEIKHYFTDCSFSINWGKCMMFKDSNNQHHIIAVPKNNDELTGNWDKSVQICAKYGATLVAIESREKQLIVQSFLGQFGEKMNSLIGWRTSGREDSNEKYFWMNNGNEITYTNWDVGQPGNDNGDNEDCLCILFKLGKWHDCLCTNELNVICEFTLNI